MHRCLGAVEAPFSCHFGGRLVSWVAFEDGVQAALVARQDVGCVRPAQDHKFGCERSQSFDLVYRPDCFIGVKCSQRRTVELAFECGVGDCVQVFGLAARQVEIEVAQPLRCWERPAVTVAVDEVVAQTSGPG